jgi:hypothetical protein
VTSNYSKVQLWNPPGNTNRLIVEAINLSSGVTGAFHIESSMAALGTMVGPGLCKKLGGTASTGILYMQASAIFSGGMLFGFTQSGQIYEKKLNEPIVILPGYGVVVESMSANADLTANFEWYEEPNV